MNSTVDTAAPAATTAPRHPLANAAVLLARILLAAIFVRGGISKIGDPAPVIANMTSHGIPLPNLLVWGAIVVELGGGLLLIAGLFARYAALVLCLYTLMLALIFHAYWAAVAAAARAQGAEFFGHLGIMGGMLAIVAFGAGAWSLDALLRQRA